MKTARYVTMGLSLLLVASAAAQAQQGSIKIGVFDPLRVSQETAVGQQIAARLKAKLDEKQAEVSRLQQEVSDLQQQAQTQALSLSDAKRNELGMQIQRKSLDLNAARETATRQLQLEQAEAQARFEENLLAVVDQYGKSEGFTLILDRGSVVWAAQATDVTTGVVDLFNQMFPGTDEAPGGTQGP